MLTLKCDGGNIPKWELGIRGSTVNLLDVSKSLNVTDSSAEQ